MKNRILALLLTLALGLSLAACAAPAAEESDPSADPSSSPSAEPAETIEVDLTQDILAFSAGLSAEDVMATVDGAEITADYYLYWLALNCLYFEAQYGIYGYTVADYADMLLSDSLSMTVCHKLLEQKVLEYGCPLTDDQTAAIQAALDEVGQETYDLQKIMYGLTDQSIWDISALPDRYDNILAAAIPAPSEEDLNGYVYQAKHILLATVDLDGEYGLREDGTYGYPLLDEETIAAQQALAEELLNQIRTSDDPLATFDALMNEYSEDGRNTDGTLAAPDGYTATNGEMVPAFEEAALALGIGEISGVVESEFGYHIILRGEVEDLDSYAEAYREQQLDGLVNTWLAEADIVESDALKALDVADFYARYLAYQEALSAQLDAESGEDGEDGVG